MGYERLRVSAEHIAVAVIVAYVAGAGGMHWMWAAVIFAIIFEVDVRKKEVLCRKQRQRDMDEFRSKNPARFDHETVEWLNILCGQAWQVLHPQMGVTLATKLSMLLVNPSSASSSERAGGGISGSGTMFPKVTDAVFESFDLGTAAPEISALRVYNNSGHNAKYMQLDADLRWTCSGRAVVTLVGGKFVKCPFEVSDVFVEGQIRVEAVLESGGIEAVSFCFIRDPNIDVSIKMLQRAISRVSTIQPPARDVSTSQPNVVNRFGGDFIRRPLSAVSFPKTIDVTKTYGLNLGLGKWARIIDITEPPLVREWIKEVITQRIVHSFTAPNKARFDLRRAHRPPARQRASVTAREFDSLLQEAAARGGGGGRKPHVGRSSLRGGGVGGVVGKTDIERGGITAGPGTMGLGVGRRDGGRERSGGGGLKLSKLSGRDCTLFDPQHMEKLQAAATATLRVSLLTLDLTVGGGEVVGGASGGRSEKGGLETKHYYATLALGLQLHQSDRMVAVGGKVSWDEGFDFFVEDTTSQRLLVKVMTETRVDGTQGADTGVADQCLGYINLELVNIRDTSDLWSVVVGSSARVHFQFDLEPVAPRSLSTRREDK